MSLWTFFFFFFDTGGLRNPRGLEPRRLGIQFTLVFTTRLFCPGKLSLWTFFLLYRKTFNILFYDVITPAWLHAMIDKWIPSINHKIETKLKKSSTTTYKRVAKEEIVGRVTMHHIYSTAYLCFLFKNNKFGWVLWLICPAI